MAQQKARNPPLFPTHTFVVQLRSDTPVEAGQMTGRVEHLTSWHAMMFESLDTLLWIGIVNALFPRCPRWRTSPLAHLTLPGASLARRHGGGGSLDLRAGAGASARRGLMQPR